jgi:tRNA-binding EMAP/Myf-like protein
MVGKNVAVITNLESRKMAGVESQGMLLGVEEKESGGPLLIFPNENIPPGAKIS